MVAGQTNSPYQLATALAQSKVYPWRTVKYLLRIIVRGAAAGTAALAALLPLLLHLLRTTVSRGRGLLLGRCSPYDCFRRYRDSRELTERMLVT